MKKKVKRFQEGGFSAAQEEWLTRGGQSPDRTDPYILARMRSAVPDTPEKSPMGDDSPAGKTSYGEQNELPQTETVTKTTVSRTPAKTTKPAVKPSAPVMPAEEKDRMKKLIAKQGLERVEPEGYIPGPRMIANLIKSGSKFLGKNKLREYTMDEFEKMTPKLGRESLKLTREPAKLGMKKGGAVKKMASGGKVSSASKRADGCAMRGKTKGRMI
jgi:hypothetical protein